MAAPVVVSRASMLLDPVLAQVQLDLLDWAIRLLLCRRPIGRPLCGARRGSLTLRLAHERFELSPRSIDDLTQPRDAVWSVDSLTPRYQEEAAKVTRLPRQLVRLWVG